MDLSDLDRFFDAYIECALWSSTNHQEDIDNGGPEYMDGLEADFHPAVLDALETECADFIRENAADLADLDAEQCGHDFWLTRNHHGAGFWDRGYGQVGKRLTEASHAYGSVDLYIGDDGLIYAGGYEPKRTKDNPMGV